MAVVEFHLSPEYFETISLWDFSLYAERNRRDVEKRAEDLKFIYNHSWDQTRTLWATIVNATGGLEGGIPAKYEDLIKLEIDKAKENEEETQPKVSLKEMKSKFGSTFKYGVN